MLTYLLIGAKKVGQARGLYSFLEGSNHSGIMKSKYMLMYVGIKVDGLIDRKMDKDVFRGILNFFGGGLGVPKKIHQGQRNLTPIFLPLGHNSKRGVRISYHELTNFGVCPLCPNECFFPPGQRLTISNFIFGIF